MQHTKELAAGTICIAGRSHTATRPNEIGFEKGEVITLIADPTGVDPHMCFLPTPPLLPPARHQTLFQDKKYRQATLADGTIGLIPISSMLERPGVLLEPMPWFHGPITRFDAEKILDRNQEGQFLMRTSQSTQGVYALAVTHGGKINHYLVAMDFSTRKLTINGQRYFNNLLDLVEYYNDSGDDLGTCLRVPRIRRGLLEYYVDTETLQNKWGLSQNHLIITDQSIGKGEFGEVVTGTYRECQVAVKRVHESKQTGAPVTALLREAAVMTHLRHKNLVQLVGLVFKGSALQYIVMEVMGKGSLQKYLISRGRTVVSQVELLSFSRDVCAGMEYIVSQRFVHRDLAARNILLNSNGQAKISDFGMARKMDIHVPHEGGKFPIKWTAPEALKDSKFSSKSDVWSFGVFLWEVFSYGRTPYPSIPADEVLENIEDGYVMDPPEGCPQGIYDVMCQCWLMEPKDRPTFKALEQLLPKTFAETVTPCASPLPMRKTVTLPQIDELLQSPVATQAYREAPISRKANMFTTNLTFLGPLGSGKTSLMRNLLGQAFRLTEPPTLNILFSESYFSLTEHLYWSPSSSALMYEDELVRIITEDLLRHAQSLVSAGRWGAESGAGSGVGSGETPPPLPPVRRRSQSFSEVHGSTPSSLPDTEAVRASNRLSGSFEVIESGTPEGKLQMGYRPKRGAERGPTPPRENHRGRTRHATRKNFISRLFTSKGKGKSVATVQRHYSDSVQRTHYTGLSTSNGNVSTTYYSTLPERLVDKIRSELRGCTDSSLSPQYFGKLIDMPGTKAFNTIRSLFITDYSVCVLVYDISRDLHSAVSPAPRRKISSNSLSEGKTNGTGPESLPENTYFNQIMADFNNLCLHWSHSDADMTLRGPRIILVGTHSDKIPSSISHKNFEKLRNAIKSSPYQKYVAMMKYVLSSSSVIERSNMDDLKRFTIEVVKKSCRQQLPLKWLRCVRRFLGLSNKGIRFISLEDARKIVSDMCDLTPEEDVSDVIRSLHHNHIVLHFAGVHQLSQIVFTNPAWFAHQVGAIFGAAASAELDLTVPPRVKADQHLLQVRGILTSQLLEFVWRDRGVHAFHDKLLTILHKMDLVCCLGPNSQPVVPSASPDFITQDLSADSFAKPQEKLSIISVVVPSVMTEPIPPHLSRMPTFKLEPLHFRFKNGFVPFGVFPRLVVRCIHSYPLHFTLFSNAAIFEVDGSTLLLITEGKDRITLSLHRGRQSATGSPLGFTPTNLDEILENSEPPNLDTCMAVQMFLQAAISDIIQQWFPQVDYDLCMECKCKISPAENEGPHYVILSQTDDVLQRVSLDCEHGSQVIIESALYSWFGETPKPHSPAEDAADYITNDDIKVVCQPLGSSWPVLGQTLGFSRTELERVAMTSKTHLSAAKHMLEEWKTLYKQNATFFALLGALEIIQRRDIADDLVASRMSGDGITL